MLHHASPCFALRLGYEPSMIAGAKLAFEELKYDNDGRITSQFLHPKPAARYAPGDNLAYDDDNRLSTWNSATVTFDADGNMTNGPLPSGTLGAYDYDSRNRLTSVGGSGYRYSPDGLRVEITGTGLPISASPIPNKLQNPTQLPSLL